MVLCVRISQIWNAVHRVEVGKFNINFIGCLTNDKSLLVSVLLILGIVVFEDIYQWSDFLLLLLIANLGWKFYYFIHLKSQIETL